MTPVVVRFFFSQARSYQVRICITSEEKSFNICCIEVVSTGFDLKFTGHAICTGLSLVSGASSGKSSSTGPTGASKSLSACFSTEI